MPEAQPAQPPRPEPAHVPYERVTPPHGPDDPKTGFRVVRAESAHESQSGISYIMAITGLVTWSVQTYLVHPVPPQVSAALYVLVPAVVGWVSTHITIKRIVLLCRTGDPRTQSWFVAGLGA